MLNEAMSTALCDENATDFLVAMQTSISMTVGAVMLYAIFVIWLQSTVNKAFIGGSIAPQGWLRFKKTPSRLPK